MSHGKKTCEALRQIRIKIAEANNIPYEPTVCNHKGNCRGTMCKTKRIGYAISKPFRNIKRVFRRW